MTEQITMIQTELAKSLEISKAKMNGLDKTYDLQGIKSGNTIKYPASEVSRLIQSYTGKKIDKKIITVNNIKGGPGKTSMTKELGYSIAQHGPKTVMIDLDLQGTLSLICGVYNDELPTWKNIMAGEINVEELLIPLRENLFIIPCNIGFGDWARVVDKKNIALLVKKYVDRLMEEHGFEAVVIDTRPEVSDINLAAIIASDTVLIPSKADIGSEKGIFDTFNEISLAEKEYGIYRERPLERLICINLFKSSRNTELQKFAEINQTYKEHMFPEVLNDNNDMAKSYNEVSFLYDQKRTSVVCKYMRELAKRLLNLDSIIAEKNEQVNHTIIQKIDSPITGEVTHV